MRPFSARPSPWFVGWLVVVEMDSMEEVDEKPQIQRIECNRAFEAILQRDLETTYRDLDDASGKTLETH